MSEVIPRKRLDGKVAIVTGGASGIGEATARRFAAEGARAVVIVDIQDEQGQQIAEEMGLDRCTYMHCDVSDEDQVKSTVDHIVQTYGKLDIMFCNAGVINKHQSIQDLDINSFDRLFSVNVRGTALSVKHAGKAMVKGNVKGSIICTASVVASKGGEARVEYVMSKHAVLGLVQSACVDLGKHGIRVNCVSPFAVATPLLCGNLGLEAEELERRFSTRTSLQGIVLKPEHIADAVLFLASDESAFVSGHNLVVDGGFLHR